MGHDIGHDTDHREAKWLVHSDSGPRGCTHTSADSTRLHCPAGTRPQGGWSRGSSLCQEPPSRELFPEHLCGNGRSPGGQAWVSLAGGAPVPPGEPRTEEAETPRLPCGPHAWSLQCAHVDTRACRPLESEPGLRRVPSPRPLHSGFPARRCSAQGSVLRPQHRWPPTRGGLLA